MNATIIEKKLLSYQSKTTLEQENALKEIMQEIALMALSRADFFRIAAFQGGTCLRILHGLERFSEDLDFVLAKPDPHFKWIDYIHSMQEEFSAYGYTLEVQDRTKFTKAVKVAFLKTDSAGGQLIIKDNRTNKPKLRIKLEIDTNPPAGSVYELRYLDFPLPYSIRAQDLPSLFAGKCHALLCRDHEKTNYVKGRDWYDFTWYLAKQIPINFTLLSSALNQAGPWREQNMHVTSQWLLQALANKINHIDWQIAKQDVMRFLKDRELKTLDLWSADFFMSRLDKLSGYLQ